MSYFYSYMYMYKYVCSSAGSSICLIRAAFVPYSLSLLYYERAQQKQQLLLEI